VSQAKKMYESEREYIEGMYWDARDQLRQRLLALVEERRRKLREEKEGGDIVTGTCGMDMVVNLTMPKRNPESPWCAK
jgi:hypothetical protein